MSTPKKQNQNQNQSKSLKPATGKFVGNKVVGPKDKAVSNDKKPFYPHVTVKGGYPGALKKAGVVKVTFHGVSLSEKSFEVAESKTPVKAEGIVRNVYAKAVKSGHYVVVTDGKNLVQVHKTDGKKVIGKVSPYVQIPKGTVYEPK